MDLQLKGKKALVLGASAGIGRAIAQTLIAEGATVAIAARTADKLTATAKEIGAAHHFPCDLSQTGAARELTTTAIKSLGGLDILVTNTGGPKRGTFTEISDEQWHKDFQNLWMSVVESLNVALPHMQKQKFGRVLMVTSFAAREPRAGLTTSNGLRAGLNGLCKSISTEYAAHGITVNVLMPGFTNTDRIKEINMPEEKVKSLIPAGRVGEPEELAALAAFLASPRAGYITGQNIAVDGGALHGF
jgi:3-oxoacyl-[acyl-carrier protein] reductase